MPGLRVKHRIIGTNINIKPFTAGKKSLNQLLLNGGFVAELLDVSGGEIGATCHGMGTGKKLIPIINAQSLRAPHSAAFWTPPAILEYR